jgi:hypothetical protein
LKASGSPTTNGLYAAAGLRTIEVAQRKGTLSDTAAAEIRAILKQFSHETD